MKKSAEEKIIAWVKRQGVPFTQTDIQYHTGMPKSSACYALNKLIDAGLVRKIGIHKKSDQYEYTGAAEVSDRPSMPTITGARLIRLTNERHNACDGQKHKLTGGLGYSSICM